MARRSAWCLIITLLLCLSLLLDPALAKGQGNKNKKKHHKVQPLTDDLSYSPPAAADDLKKNKKKHHKGQPLTNDLSYSPPPPPPPAAADDLYTPTSDLSGRKGGHHKGKKKKKHDLDQSPPTTGDMPTLSPAVVDLVNKSLGVSPPTSMAPSPSESDMTPPQAASPAPTVSGSIDLIVKSNKGKSFTDHICELAANPTQCDKILAGTDKKFINSLPAGTTSMLSIELSAAVASKAVLYMSDKMTSNSIDPTETTCVQNYQDAIVGFAGAYANFTGDANASKKSLNDADVKIGLCESSLASGKPQSFLPQMDDTNKLLRSLIQLVLKEFPH